MLIDFFTSELRKTVLGTKSYNLLDLKSRSIQVPGFTIVDPVVFDFWILQKELPQSFCEQLDLRLAKFNSNYFSVRSSMNLEDGENDSFAGMLETFLFVPKEDILKYLKLCFESINNERIQSYLAHKNIPNENLSMSVVIQEMVDSHASGVVFTRSPCVDNGLILIESGFGLGEGIVSGLVEVDQYLIDRKFNIIKKDIAKKTKMVKKSRELTSIQDVPEKDSETPSISPKHALELAKVCLEIEEIYNHPCDIEWALHNEEIYILQTRPITQKYGPLELYIDTNLSESYPGLTSKFTGSFVTKMYQLVHEEIGHYLKFSKKRMNLLHPYFSTMTSFIDGHMYYRLKSYYSLLLSIPGGKQNLKNWHRMIGTSDQYFDFETSEITPTALEKILYFYSIIKLVLFHDQIFNKFNKVGNKDLGILQSKLDKAKNAKEVSRVILNAVTKSYGFGLTGLNDLLAMKGLNAIVVFLEKNKLDPKLLTQVIKTNETVDSLLPLLEMQRLRKEISKNFLLKLEDILNCSVKITPHHRLTFALDTLEKEFPTDVVLCRDYLIKYGHRSFEELKIESLSLFHDCFEFLKLLKNKSVISNNQKDSFFKIQDLNLNLLDSIKLRVTAYFTQKFIKRREQARLLRGRFYSFIRISMIRFYDKLVLENKISKNIELSNIFNLALTDLEKIEDISDEKLASKIYPNTSYPEYYFKEVQSTETPYFNQVLEAPELTSDMISGLGASNGEVTARVLIVYDPKEISDTLALNKRILVTQNTDPAWIHLMASSVGLISEKGSLLSHTAIIGREMNIPTVVGVQNATRLLKNNQLIKMNGKSGIITILEDSNEN